MLAIAYKPMIVNPVASHDIDLKNLSAEVYLTMSGFDYAYIKVNLTFDVKAHMDRYEQDTGAGGYYYYDVNIIHVISAKLFDEEQFCIGTVEIDDDALREIIQLLEQECEDANYGELNYGSCNRVNSLAIRNHFNALNYFYG